jgi:hypothetical protein
MQFLALKRCLGGEPCMPVVPGRPLEDEIEADVQLEPGKPVDTHRLTMPEASQAIVKAGGIPRSLAATWWPENVSTTQRRPACTYRSS